MARWHRRTFLHASDGIRQISRSAYDEIVSKASEFDLFVDAVVPQQSRKYTGGRRLRNGSFERCELSRVEASAIAELVVRGTAVRARDLNALLGILHPARTIESARRKVDVRLARFTWRAIHTIAAGAENDCQYASRATKM